MRRAVRRRYGAQFASFREDRWRRRELWRDRMRISEVMSRAVVTETDLLRQIVLAESRTPECEPSSSRSRELRYVVVAACSGRSVKTSSVTLCSVLRDSTRVKRVMRSSIRRLSAST